MKRENGCIQSSIRCVQSDEAIKKDDVIVSLTTSLRRHLSCQYSFCPCFVNTMGYSDNSSVGTVYPSMEAFVQAKQYHVSISSKP